MTNETKTIEGEIVQEKPKVKITKVAKKKEAGSDGEKAMSLWEGYRDKAIVNDFTTVPTYAKLTMLQHVESRFVKQKKLTGNVTIPYIPHEFAEKALNFAFNFNVDVEVIESSSKEGKTGDGKGYIEVNMQVKFTFFDESRGRSITRTVFSGHKGFKNPATTEADVYKSALSKAYTIVARTFGIGANVKDPSVQDIKAKYKAVKKTQANQEPKQEVVRMSDLEEEAYNAMQEDQPFQNQEAQKDWMNDQPY